MEEIKQLDRGEAEQILKLPNSWIDKGIERGIEKGKIEEKKKIALEMLKEGLSIDLIVKVTHLSNEEIEILQENK
ncbi:hypothetical protein M670_03492 [Schinkia azotoformans MEV2011]|uniref:Transposase n=1 Tax=Schinkia azotoformans MEV2011 TaxID=1348973 RepID=A0A072NIB9_SCHAZ|nr:hypothetical protein [Schinkia azotoformans]KEF37246.1 hypothetical protein M670_03492 [Schinkia azotoformans MEV2011]MEC1697371.1 hypothetical protein [Schinkia azotoformans]MEC1724348.1 hypothetical protein [Schinkia azotoformans]MEC1773283.1 hypothetical protein [Schinkia azotoformans]MEC1779005.1 hypothetical protein [Schinkia azotoformans]